MGKDKEYEQFDFPPKEDLTVIHRRKGYPLMTFNQAVRNLFMAFCEEFGIKRLCEFLARRIRNGL